MIYLFFMILVLKQDGVSLQTLADHGVHLLELKMDDLPNHLCDVQSATDVQMDDQLGLHG